MSKLSFRARALDASKPMPIFMAEELPDLPDYSAINRAVPQMPSGMQKEEECEHHLQRAIVAGLIIPTPEVTDLPAKDFYDKVYPANYKQPRQLIHMQPLTMEQDIPDYDMDSDDERWLQSQTPKIDLSPLKFEEMMDRLEKSSGQTVVTLTEAKGLLKEDDDLTIAVFDYWLNKRLKTQHPLILTVKTEHRAGQAANNPYLAFRRRTEKMQTRKNRKNDEVSYEKMLKLRRDLCRAVTMLELVKRREKMKREHVHLSVEVFEKRFQSKDFSGSIIAEASALKSTRPAFTPIFHNHYTNQTWSNKAAMKDEAITRREKRPYKKRKHKPPTHSSRAAGNLGGVGGADLAGSSDDETVMPQLSSEPDEPEDEGLYAFRRNKQCSYHMPLPQEGNWPWCSKEDNGLADRRYRFTLTSLSNPRRCIGFARRRVGRGGRIILDRVATDHDDFWRTLDFSIVEPNKKEAAEPSSEVVKDSEVMNELSDKLIVKKRLVERLTANNLLRNEDISSDFSHYSSLRTSVSECDSVNEIKEELVDRLPSGTEPSVVEEGATASTGDVQRTKEEKEEMLDYLRSLRKDWLHFRPKTPPPDYEALCHLLPADDYFFAPSANTPFCMEIENLDEPLLGSSPFLSAPFMLDGLDMDVPITDTRQTILNSSGSSSSEKSNEKHVQIGPNTLNNISVSNKNSCNVSLNDCSVINGISECDGFEERTAGCSTFTVTDCGASGSASASRKTIRSNATATNATVVSAPSKFHTSTLTSPKYNNSVSEMRPRTTTMTATGLAESAAGSTNGLITQFGFDVPPNNNRAAPRNNKLYAYSSPSSGAAGFSTTSTSGATKLSLHTSAHTLTLNSHHSANILEIPISNEPESKLVSTQLTEGATNAANSKKTIVRKNNLIMEVT